MAKPDVSSYRDFGQITDRLDEIIDAVRDKDTSLERSLDLFDEAIALGSKAVDMVDTTDISDEERARLQSEQRPSQDGSADTAEEPGSDADEEPSPGNGDADASGSDTAPAAQ